MLNRLKGERLWENVVNYLGIGLRVDALAATMALDGAAMAAAVLDRPPARKGTSKGIVAPGSAPSMPASADVPVVYEGNHGHDIAQWRT